MPPVPPDDEPLLRATATELAVAPELGVLAALDATLATAAYQLVAEHPELGLEALARGHPPSREARQASRLVCQMHRLRAALRSYRRLTLEPDRDEPAF